MKRAFRSGFSFGLTSGTITTLGLIVGLHASTDTRIVVIGGILTIAVVDAFSDSVGMHMAQEAQNYITHKLVWMSTIFTFLFKFIFSSIFIIPVLIFDLHKAILISGDSDFLDVVRKLKELKKEIEIWSFKKSTSRSLIEEAGQENVHYIDEILDEIRY